MRIQYKIYKISNLILRISFSSSSIITIRVLLSRISRSFSHRDSHFRIRIRISKYRISNIRTVMLAISLNQLRQYLIIYRNSSSLGQLSFRQISKIIQLIISYRMIFVRNSKWTDIRVFIYHKIVINFLIRILIKISFIKIKISK